MTSYVPSLGDLRDRVNQGLVTEVKREHLSIFNYTRRCTYERAWDDVTLASRGLILDSRTARPAALPFTKFFNYGELGIDQTVPATAPDCVTTKMDGSLGISYVFDGKLCWATRGTFYSEQAKVAQEIWDARYGHVDVPPEWTLLVEIVSPRTKNVVTYDWEDLVLLGIRDIETGEDLPFERVQEWGFSYCMNVVERVDLDLTAAVEAARVLTHQDEGFVIRWGDFRLKVKSKQYMEVARLLQGLTPRTVSDLWYAKVRPDSIPSLPEEHRDMMVREYSLLDERVQDLEAEVVAIHDAHLDAPDRKTYVERVRSSPRFGLLMQVYTGKVVDYRLATYREKHDAVPRHVDLSSIGDDESDE